jgi:hypothetical protein
LIHQSDWRLSEDTSIISRTLALSESAVMSMKKRAATSSLAMAWSMCLITWERYSSGTGHSPSSMHALYRSKNFTGTELYIIMF